MQNLKKVSEILQQQILKFQYSETPRFAWIASILYLKWGLYQVETENDSFGYEKTCKM
jgi:hypothetical protein